MNVPAVPLTCPERLGAALLRARYGKMLWVEMNGRAFGKTRHGAVERFAPMHQARVIPEYDIAWPPVVCVHILVAGTEVLQFFMY